MNEAYIKWHYFNQSIIVYGNDKHTKLNDAVTKSISSYIRSFSFTFQIENNRIRWTKDVVESFSMF